MSVSTPVISVIVVCKNPGPHLKDALNSVWAQREVSVELIVIDGGSTDGSREWLESQRGRIATLVSAPDSGVYEAMNKGLAATRGEWVLFLGADDRLDRDRVLTEAAGWLAGKKPLVAAGEAIYRDRRVYKLCLPLNPLARNFAHHQATFYHCSLFNEAGGFDPSLAIMGDYDFNLRLWKKNVAFSSLPLRIAICGTSGLSDSGRWRGYAEEIRVRHRYFPAWKCWLWDALSIVRYVRKKTIRCFAR
ncbi:MAG TPA: glycosyltransferase family 2 protein [Opitutaceae bacterium]|nr:glycosyltransferase family 2 protein [Opitutaceae bacterium]